ncbi:sulfite exporter TauE/SafE family protein [Neisseria animalis]|uniref:Probable membrane transporter protein n=1 Tax=Neisseria animalis TaxID=492 RepID=A0A5P3MSF1_NEIAN|nr:sulfite exporter TauE/SafE family protein [Neisseria animalis]QEY23569.1 sulfite exporter TauE/SafE family protein [Neisseria animalis]ROW32714.1 sulfite exporter TauE/SafE family protein [Neisseria animalis]VEE09241.1 Sulfite exporter TauE/SafE [Neisseria animalis]
METTLYFLVLIGFLAGLMDAAVGGGGLLQIPGLFNILPHHTPVPTVLGVGKVASFSGTATATWQYVRKIPVPWKMLLPAALLAFAASYLGAKSVAYFPTEYMKPVMLLIMLAMFAYTFWKKDLGQTVRTRALTRKETLWGLFFGGLIGFYDGIFGPGTGSLLAFVFVRFYGYDFLTANASGKVINLTTNFAALTFFVPNGHVVWAWAVPLALANLCGGIIGARLAIRGGTVFLRYGFMALLCLIIGKFAWDLWAQTV